MTLFQRADDWGWVWGASESLSWQCSKRVGWFEKAGWRLRLRRPRFGCALEAFQEFNVDKVCCEWNRSLEGKQELMKKVNTL